MDFSSRTWSEWRKTKKNKNKNQNKNKKKKKKKQAKAMYKHYVVPGFVPIPSFQSVSPIDARESKRYQNVLL